MNLVFKHMRARRGQSHRAMATWGLLGSFLLLHSACIGPGFDAYEELDSNGSESSESPNTATNEVMPSLPTPPDGEETKRGSSAGTDDQRSQRDPVEHQGGSDSETGPSDDSQPDGSDEQNGGLEGTESGSTETDAGLDPEGDAETETDAGLDPEGEAETETDGGLDPEGEAETETDGGLDPGGEAETETDGGLDPGGEAETETDGALDPSGDTETDGGWYPEEESETGTDGGSTSGDENDEVAYEELEAREWSGPPVDWPGEGLSYPICKNDSDVMIDQSNNTTCYRGDYNWNVLNPCPKHYVRTGHYDEVTGEYEDICICANKDVCGVWCAEDSDCQRSTYKPWVNLCEPHRKICISVQRCYHDEMCPEGEYCTDDEICEPRPTISPKKSRGESCNHNDHECESGVCYRGVCLDACERGADCRSEEVCGDFGGCIPQDNSPCKSGCSESKSCNWREGVCRESCLRNSDCSEGECHATGSWRSDHNGRWSCSEPDSEYQDYGCRSYEYVEWNRSIGTACLLYETCWSDADCLVGYNCLLPRQGAAPGPGPDESGICGRAVTGSP